MACTWAPCRVATSRTMRTNRAMASSRAATRRSVRRHPRSGLRGFPRPFEGVADDGSRFRGPSRVRSAWRAEEHAALDHTHGDVDAARLGRHRVRGILEDVETPVVEGALEPALVDATLAQGEVHVRAAIEHGDHLIATAQQGHARPTDGASERP